MNDYEPKLSFKDKLTIGLVLGVLALIGLAFEVLNALPCFWFINWLLGA